MSTEAGTASHAALGGHEHIVQFYGSDRSLVNTVAAFLAEGLVAAQPAIVIATAAHCSGIVEELGARLVDVPRAIRQGDLIMLDAEATLDLFMVSSGPDPELFEENIGRLIEQASNGRRTIVRAYGEMVDVLWKQGRTEAAIKLEILWNRLAQKYHFTLLCGYAMGSFYKQTAKLEEVIAQHTRVVGHGRGVVPFSRKRPPSSKA
jgi:hypothetical protein